MSNNGLPGRPCWPALTALVTLPMVALLAGLAPEPAKPERAPPAPAPKAVVPKAANANSPSDYDAGALARLQGPAAAAAARGDYASLAELVAASAERGDPLAMSVLGLLHADARGVPLDRIAAERFWLAAAERGEASAARNLARLYTRGVLGMPDPARANEWLRRADDKR